MSATGLPVRASKPRPKDNAPRPWICSTRDSVFCPVCGECTCGTAERCPLHSKKSQHGTRREMIR